MDLAKLAISRPYAVAVGFLIAVLIGAFSLTRLPIDLMPDITYPTLSVNANYPGVGPEEIETLLTEPLESAVAAVQGLEEVTSNSQEGQASVRMSFRWGTDLDEAANDIRARIDRIRDNLPEGASAPEVRKFDLAAFPVVFLAVSGDLDPLALKRLAENQIQPRLERLPGVAAVNIRGGLDREVRVEVDRGKLQSLNLTMDDVRAALGRENLNTAAGKVEDNRREMGLRMAGEFLNLQDIAETAVATRNGQAIRVRDLGVVIDTYEDVTELVTIDGVPTLQLAISKQSGTNTVQVAEAVVKEVEALNADLRNARLTVTNDTSRFIRRAIEGLQKDLMIGAVLAVGVMLFFLRSVRSTLIIATAIPISVVTTFALLYFQNFTLNIMSLGGLALAIGRLVDDSIVVLENIYRHRAMGKSPKQAALDGTRQVSLAVIASTATTIAVFVPLIFLTGMTGVMFQQLSLVVVFSLACSTLVAQGIIPLFASRFLKDAAPPTRPFARKAYDASGSWLSGLENRYARALDWVLKRPKRVVALIAAALVGSLALMPLVGTEFMPSADEGEIRINAETPVGSTLEVTEAKLNQIEAVVREAVPEAELIIAEAGDGGWRSSGAHLASMRIILVPSTERTRSSEAIAADLRAKVARIPGVTSRVSPRGGLFIMRLGQSDGEKVGVQIRGHDFETARRLTREVQAAMEKTPGIADVRASRQDGRPEQVVRVDRAKAAAMGVSVTAVARALEAGMLGVRATGFREAGDEFNLTVRLREDQRRSIEQALDLPVMTASGRTVPLRNMVSVAEGIGPSAIDRDSQERVINVNAELQGADLGTTIAALRENLREIDVPSTFALVVTGDFEEQQKAFLELATALALALLLVFLVMVAQFESLKSPFVIFFSVPACATGVIGALLLTGTTLNVQSFIGIIVLVGIVVSNGIIMVEFMNQLHRDEGRPVEEVVREAARVRLRPVLMTTITTLLAMLPMAIGLGEGAEMHAPMG
ncbi:MAG: efflux RND transporter permease subunit, partial [Candidatus Sericytochromatia bacterium]